MQRGKEPKAWGYLIPQNTTEKDYNKYVVSVDAVEKATGVGFYSELDDRVEKRIEMTTDIFIIK